MRSQASHGFSQSGCNRLHEKRFDQIQTEEDLQIHLNSNWSENTGCAIQTPARHLSNPSCTSVRVSSGDMLCVIFGWQPAHEGHGQSSFNRSCHLKVKIPSTWKFRITLRVDLIHLLLLHPRPRLLKGLHGRLRHSCRFCALLNNDC